MVEWLLNMSKALDTNLSTAEKGRNEGERKRKGEGKGGERRRTGSKKRQWEGRGGIQKS